MWVQIFLSFGYISFTGTRYSHFIDISHVGVPFQWSYKSARVLALAAQCLARFHGTPTVSSPCWISGSLSLFLHDITLLRLSINPELGLKDTNSSLCALLLGGRLDALLFLQFSDLHLMFSVYRVPNGLGVLIMFNLPHGECHFRLQWLTSCL